MGTQTVWIVAGGAVLLILISIILAAALARSGRKRKDEAAYEAYTAERKAALREAEAEQQARKEKEAAAAEPEPARLIAPDAPTEEKAPEAEAAAEEKPEEPAAEETPESPEEEAEEAETQEDQDNAEEETEEDEDVFDDEDSDDEDLDEEDEDDLMESHPFESEDDRLDRDEELLAEELVPEEPEAAEEIREPETAGEPEKPEEAAEPAQAEEPEEPAEIPQAEEMLIRTLRNVAVRPANIEPTAARTGEPVSFIAIGKNLFVRQEKRIIGSVRKRSEAEAIMSWVHSGNPVEADLTTGNDGELTLTANLYGDPLETAEREGLEPVKLHGTKSEEVQALLRELKPGTPCTATYTAREGKSPVWAVTCEAGCIGRLDEDEYEEGRGLAVAEVKPSKKDESRLKATVFVF